MLGGEEGSKGPRGAPEEAIEPAADIDGGQFRGNAGEEAVFTAGAWKVEAEGADQMAVHRLDHLAPAGVLAFGRCGLRALIVGGREEGGTIGVAPMLLPPRPAEARIGQIRSTTARARAARRPARPGGADIGDAIGTARGR